MTTNIEEILVCQKCAHDKALQMKLEDERYQGKFISYADNYYDITLTNEEKGIRKLHHDFNKQTSKFQISYNEDYLRMDFSEHSNGISYTIVCN